MTSNPLPSTMAAVLLTGHGGLEKLEYRTDVPVPSPAPGEVLVEVTACKTRPLVGGVYALSDFHRAQSDFMAKDFVGKLVVVPDSKTP